MSLFSRSPNADGEDGSPAATSEGGSETSPRHTIGDLLRETRQSYGGEIDRIAGTLRIRGAYLTAIEESHYDKLPGPVYAQGFVRAYAVHLGLDGDEAIRRFKQEVAGFEVTRDLSFPMPLVERSIPGGTMVLAALILAICGYGLWYYVSTGDRAHPERVSAVPPDLVAATQPPPPLTAPDAAAPAPPPATPDGATPAAPPTVAPTPPLVVTAGAPPPAVALTPAPTSPPTVAQAPAAAPPPTLAPPPNQAPPQNQAPTPVPAPEIAAAPPTDAAASGPARVYGVPPNVPARIVVHAVKDSWVQVSNSGGVITERILHPGDTVRVPDQPGLSLRTGNGAGIELEIDGKLGKPLSGTVRTVALDADRLSGHAPQAN
jgi:cytoskeleton protein RodZ